jgi:uncharacterized membrane protein YphA (DoxX/SURF4 family)
MVAAPMIAEGIGVVRDPAPHAQILAPITAQLAKHTGLEDNPTAGAKATGYALVAAGAAAALGILPRLAGAAAAAVLVPAAAVGYPFWTISDDPEARAKTRQEFLRHLGLAGAALLIAAGGAKPRRSRRSASSR